MVASDILVCVFSAAVSAQQDFVNIAQGFGARTRHMILPTYCHRGTCEMQTEDVRPEPMAAGQFVMRPGAATAPGWPLGLASTVSFVPPQ